MVDISRETTLKLLINSKLNRRCRLGNVQFTFPNLHASSIFIYFDVSERPREYNKNVYVLFYPKIHRGGGRWYCGGKRVAANCERCTRAESSTSSLRVSSARHLHFYLFPRGSPFSAPVKFKEPLLSSRATEKARSTVTGARLSDERSVTMISIEFDPERVKKSIGVSKELLLKNLFCIN